MFDFVFLLNLKLKKYWKQKIPSICLQCRRSQFDSWVGKISWRRDRLPTPVFLGFAGGSVGKETFCNAGDLCLAPGLGGSPGEGSGHPPQYSCLENSMDRAAWQVIVPGITKSQTQLGDFQLKKKNEYGNQNGFYFNKCIHTTSMHMCVAEKKSNPKPLEDN